MTMMTIAKIVTRILMVMMMVMTMTMTTVMMVMMMMMMMTTMMMMNAESDKGSETHSTLRYMLKPWSILWEMKLSARLEKEIRRQRHA